MIIKVCGIKYQDNFDKIVDIAVDMVGLNFYKASSRYIAEDLSVEKITHKKSIVGVFVNESLKNIKEQVKKYKLDYVQLHGDESSKFCSEVADTVKVIKAFAIAEPLDFDVTTDYQCCDFFLFDTKTKGYGGSGKKFDWEILDSYNGEIPFLLAGGIGPGDSELVSTICHSRFAGVDINSRFEIRPGEKNIDEVILFASKCKKIKH